MPTQSTRPASTDASMLDLRAHPNAPTYKNLGGKLYPTTPASRAEAIVTLLVDRNHWHGMYQDSLDANVELAAEVKRLNAVAASTTVLSVEAMRDSFAAARDYCYKHANTADDPARPHAAGQAWEAAVNAVEELLGAVSPVDAPTGEAGPACAYFGDKCNSSRCPKHGGAADS